MLNTVEMKIKINKLSTTITETKATPLRLTFVNNSFRTLAALFFALFSQPLLQTLVHPINTNRDIHTGLRSNAGTMAVLSFQAANGVTI
jgi:hypothetical protein